MSVITISRQLGTQGLAVARQTAEALGYRLYWRDIINQAAIRAGAPEIALAFIDELNLLDICPSPKDCEAYHTTVSQIMQAIAREGQAVILGRAGQVILSDWPGSVHVRLMAPAAMRSQTIAAQQNISMAAAQAQIETSDRYRQTYLERFYHVAWDDPCLYDLILNVGNLSVDQTTDIILHAYKILSNRAGVPGEAF
jgi:cytidylate kinase